MCELGSEGGPVTTGVVTPCSSPSSLSLSSLSIAVCHESGMERSSWSMIWISGCSAGEGRGGFWVVVGVLVDVVMVLACEG